MLVRRKVVLVVAAIASAVMPVAAQAPAQKPSFEVASVKPGRERTSLLNVAPGGRFSATGFTLKWLIGFAYRLREDQMLGGPTWITKDLWDIEAKAAEGSVPPHSSSDNTKPDTTALMLQSLLEDRFQLRLHSETRDFPVYLLTVGKGGPKLNLSKDQTDVNVAPVQNVPLDQPHGMMRRTPDGVTANTVPLSLLTNFLSQQLGRPILDKTGLEGLFDFKLHWTPPPIAAPGIPAGPDAASDPSGVSIFTAIQELGLKLEAAKAPLEVLVIESVQRPTEN